ncbi:PGF-CTERM sorting domain-containing protein [Geoglobus acetivorans]|uniref:PGF-CTERM sorting domain-containing protein n=1 Tax=Geoglobus acetivorans TaxID=565033 RepID=A0ABZ3H4A3_GEOAI|nr:hypothetical protein [Geoglobus acetivorans]
MSEKNYGILLKSAFAAAILAIVMAFAAVSAAGAEEPYEYSVNNVNPEWIISADEFYRWHEMKDAWGPTFAGSPAWQSYMNFLEDKLKEYGVVDIIRNNWTYTRWYTTEWPDDSGWSLYVDGVKIRVASYSAYSGSTDEDGVTAPLVYYDPANPPESIEGKIVVFSVAPHPKPPYSPKYLALFTFNDYEYLSDPETFPPIHTPVSTNVTVSLDVWYQLNQVRSFAKIMAEGKAAGGLVIFNMSYDRAAGLYTFPVPSSVLGVPTLFLDREARETVKQAALEGKNATLRLVAKEEPAEVYQLIGFLPGKNYGTPDDEIVLLITHTDGPSISQENGALGLLGVVGYFSHIPQEERPRTLMVYLDSRHYMPGKEEQWAEYDWLEKHPEVKEKIVGLIAMEHLGQVEYREVGNKFEPTGLVEPSFLWTQNNQKLIDMAIKAVKDSGWPRVQVQCVDRPGVHGESQGIWYGMGKIARKWKVPAFATMGTQGAYWATSTGIEKFDKDLFYRQVAAMTQLTGELMLGNLEELKPVETPTPAPPSPTPTPTPEHTSTPEPVSTPTATETPKQEKEEETPGFELILSTVGLLVAVYALRRGR